MRFHRGVTITERRAVLAARGDNQVTHRRVEVAERRNVGRRVGELRGRGRGGHLVMLRIRVRVRVRVRVKGER